MHNMVLNIVHNMVLNIVLIEADTVSISNNDATHEST